MIEGKRWSLTIGLFVVCFLFSGYNLVMHLLTKRTKRTHSLVPLIGGLAGAIGCFLIPIPIFRYFFWLPLFLDLGCFPGIISAFRVRRSR